MQKLLDCDKMQKIMLIGSYGQTNLGDDALMFSYLSLIKDVFGPDVKIYANANEKANVPAIIKKEFGKSLVLFETYKTSLLKKIEIIKNSDFVIFGGGSLFKELPKTTGRNKYSTLIYLFQLIFLAKLLGKTIIALNIGIGPLKTFFGRALAKAAINNIDLLIVRDHHSYQYASNFGKKKGLIESSDGAFLFDWGKIPGKVKPAQKKSSLTIGVNFHHNISEEIGIDKYIGNVVATLNILLEKYPKANIVFFPFQTAFNPNNEKDFFAKTILPKIKNKDRISIASDLELTNIVQKMKTVDVFIGTRFHSSVFAIITQTPFISVSYDEKCLNLMKDLNYSYFVPLSKFEPKTVIKTLEKVLYSKEKIRKEIIKARQNSYIKSRLTKDALARCVN